MKAQGENVKAIAELVKYLKDFMADGEAWMELCDLYILEQDYAKASFCCEELILQHPHNHLYYQRFVCKLIKNSALKGKESLNL